MEYDNGGERPDSPEAKQEAMQRLFFEYSRLAIIKGEIEEEPADSYMEAGDDGTTNPRGQRVRPFEVTLDSAAMPESLRRRNIGWLKFTYTPPVVLSGELMDEQLFVEMREQSGIEKHIELKRNENDAITARSSLEVEANDIPNPGEELTHEMREEIIARIIMGDEEPLQLGGPEGDFARALYLRITEAASENINWDDVRMLEDLFPYVRAAL